MPIAHLHKLLTTPTAKKSSPQVIFWFSLSLTFAAIYGMMALQKAFRGEYVVQDDARQHVFWMQRFLDPELFPKDLIADYFQSIVPAGYTAFYQLIAAAGIPPLLLNKLLPILLGLITTVYCFGCAMQLLPVPLAGFISTLLLNQSLWMKFDLVSATPRAFLTPLFLAFLYYLLRGALIPTCVAIALLGLFYPQGVFICAGVLILRLLKFEHKQIRFSPTPSDLWFSAAGLAVSFVVMIFYAFKSTELGQVMTAAEAIALPEFLPKGRTPFFHKNPVYFWLIGESSGILPPLLPPLIWIGLFLPVLLRYPSRFPSVKHIAKSITILLQITLVSVGMFFAAHAVLFRLYLPNRYMEHSLRVVLALAAGMTLTLMLDAALHLFTQGNKPQRFLSLTSTIFLIAALVLYPTYTKSFPKTNYRPGRVPSLYEFFQKQPKDILIASLSGEANNLPTFALRPILVGREYAFSYHVSYSRKFRDRAADLIRAQYSPNLAEVQNFIQKYGVDFWLLERKAFTPEYLARDRWIQQYQPAAKEAIAQLQQGTIPALEKLSDRCSVFETGDFVVLKAECIAKATPNG